MGLRKAYRRLKKHKVGRWAVAGATLGASEAHRVRKKLAGSIKKNPEVWGAGIGTAFGAPGLGARIGGGLRSDEFSPTYLGSQFEGFSMPDESVAETPAPETSEMGAGFAPAIDKKWLVIGAIAIVAFILLTRKSS